MALTKAQVREILSAAGVTSENMSEAVDKIIDGHVTSVNALREDIAKYKADAEKLTTVQKELDDMKANTNDSWKEKHDKLKDEFDKYKGDIEAKETKAKVNNAVRSYLESKSITGDNLDLAMMACESIIASAELDGDKLKDTTALDTLVGSKFKRLVTHTETKGANTANPPANNGNSGVTKEDFQKMSYKDRLQIYNENPDLYNELTT